MTRQIDAARRDRWILALLVATLLLAGGLALAAINAARSHRAVAERTVGDYGEFAAWAYAEHSANLLGSAIVGRLNTLKNGRMTMQMEEGEVCPCSLVSEAGSFAVASGWRTMVTAAVPSDSLRLANLLERWADEGRLRTSETQSFSGILDSTWLIAFRSVDRRSGREIQGLAIPLDHLAGILRMIPPERPLLPTTVSPDMNQEDVLHLALVGGRGERYPVGEGLTADVFSATSPLPDQFGGLSVAVDLDRSAAGDLVVGGLPANRLPWVGILFGLTVLILVAAIYQFHRSSELTRQRAAFVTGVSHELRTPLTQIRLFLESVLLGRTGSDEERDKYLSIAYDESRRLTSLVDNVLLMSKIERNGVNLDRHMIDLSDTVRTAANSYRGMAESAGMSVALNIRPGVETRVDPDAVRQIVLNLFDNAIKYGPAGQTITIGVARNGEHARLWVRDQGPGVPVDDRGRIWEPYVRLSNGSESVGGTGIGLAVVRSLAEQHGGRVAVEQSSTGACFAVELPVSNGLDEQR